jgi:hypothetical protein
MWISFVLNYLDLTKMTSICVCKITAEMIERSNHQQNRFHFNQARILNLQIFVQLVKSAPANKGTEGTN